NVRAARPGTDPPGRARYSRPRLGHAAPLFTFGAGKERGRIMSLSNQHLRAGGYCRTSGESQRDNTSIPNQKDAVTAFCRSQGWRLVRCYVDEAKSGSKIAGRDAFQVMLRDAAEGRLDVIVPYDTTRFARDGVDVVDTAKKLKTRYGVYTVDAKNQFDN